MVLPRRKGAVLGTESYQDNKKLTRIALFVERALDLKITTMASRKRITKSELVNQLLKSGLEKNKEEFLDAAVNE